MKVCPQCRRILSMAAFGVDRHRRDGLMSRCRDCDNAKSARYYAENRERKQTYYERRKAELPPPPPKLCKVCSAPTPSRRHLYCISCRPVARNSQERERDRNRKRPDHNRRYGPQHQRARKRWARVIEEEPVACSRCGGLISPDEPWDLDHLDGGGPRDYLGPSHARCNRATAGRQKSSPVASREW